jgi:hypothetical protein
MLPSRLAVRTALAVLTATVLGCDSEAVVAPRGSLIGTYVLRSVSGNALPTLGNGSLRTDFLIIADTIRLYSSGDGTEVLVSQYDGTGAQRQVQTFTVTAPSPSRLDIEYECNDVRVQSMAACLAPPHHRLLTTATGLTMDVSALYRTPMVFERVSP